MGAVVGDGGWDLLSVSSEAPVCSDWALENLQSVCIHTQGPQIHPLDFHSVSKMYSLNSNSKEQKYPLKICKAGDNNH